MTYIFNESVDYHVKKTIDIVARKKKNRYIIFSINLAIFIPLGIWLGDWFGNSTRIPFLEFISTPQMIVIAIFCLISSDPLLYVVDTLIKVNKHLKR
ncbi:bacteriocin [Ligilactobacillus salivarius]|uniref:DUF5976 family putative bacteriocin n=1 Tax=Ligilactobacillus salivarius TaxID=1624 RepID=UPI0030D1C8DC